MDNAEIQRRILDYLIHLEDLQYLASLVETVEGPALDDLIIELLRSGDAVAVGNTCLFIRDVVLLGARDEKCRKFGESFVRSPVVSALEALVMAPDYRIRRHAVYTLGKTGSSFSLPVLHHAFHSLLEKDPLLLPSLVGEIFWLEEEDSLDLIDEALASGQYLTRWAVFSIIEQMPSQSDIASREWQIEHQLRTRACSQLLRDPNARVRAEAEYEQALLDHDAKTGSLPRPVRWASRREVERRRPSMCFEILEIRFGNHLYHHASQDYTVSELDQFVLQQVD